MGLHRLHLRSTKQEYLLLLQRLEEVNRELIEEKSKLERQVAELSFLYNITSNLMKNNHMNNLLTSILQMALEITGSEVGCILLPEILYPTRFEVKLHIGDLATAVKLYLTQDCSFLFKLLKKPEIKILKDDDKEFLPIRQLDQSLRSLMAVPLQIDNDVIGLILVMHRHSGEDEHKIDYSADDCRALSGFAQQAALILQNMRLKIEYAREDMYFNTIKAFTSAIDAKDVYTQNHSRRVAEFSVAFARELQLTEQEIMNIGYGATMHDIGKIGVPELILNKSEKLSEEEFELIKAHPAIGAKILEPIDFSKEALGIVRHHHERYDGNGYPDALRGEAIPYTARIVTIADAWDAMISRRSYRSALSFEEAVAELRQGAGSQFDPYKVKTIVNMVEDTKGYVALPC